MKEPMTTSKKKLLRGDNVRVLGGMAMNKSGTIVKLNGSNCIIGLHEPSETILRGLDGKYYTVPTSQVKPTTLTSAYTEYLTPERS